MISEEGQAACGRDTITMLPDITEYVQVVLQNTYHLSMFTEFLMPEACFIHTNKIEVITAFVSYILFV